MLNIAIIIGSTRPGRNGKAVAEWVYEIAKRREDARFEIVDIADYNLPLLDEPMGAASGQYTKPHTIAWSEKIKSFDGYVFLTPEYNHAISGALKNAIDYLYYEWNNKAAGIVGYGGGGGVRAAENLRLIAGELMLAVVVDLPICPFFLYVQADGLHFDFLRICLKLLTFNHHKKYPPRNSSVKPRGFSNVYSKGCTSLQ